MTETTMRRVELAPGSDCACSRMRPDPAKVRVWDARVPADDRISRLGTLLALSERKA